MIYYIIAAIIGVFALSEVNLTSRNFERNTNYLLRHNKSLLNGFFSDVKKNKLMVDKTRIISLIAGSLVSVFLCVFAFSRHETGYDYSAYSLIYDQSIHMGFNQLQIEPLYYIANYILKIAGIPFLGFLIAYTTLSIIPKITLIYSTSTYLMVSILVYYVNCYIMYDFGVLRQAASISLCAYACIFALNRKPWKFALLVVVAMGFHVTAIVFIPFYFLASLRLSYRLIILFALAGIVGNLLISVLFTNVYFSGLSLAFIFDKLSLYTQAAKNSDKTGLSIGFYSKLALIMFYIASFLKNKEKTTHFGEIACISYLASLSGFFILKDYAVIASRLFVYYKLSEIVLLPDLIRLQKAKTSKILMTLFIIAIQFYQLYRDLNQDYSEVLFPYKINPDLSLLNWFLI